MEGRAIRLLLGSLLVAIVIFWIVKPKRTHVAVAEAGILPPGADAQVQGVRLLQEGPQGDLALTAHDAEWSREGQNFHLNGVDIRVLVVDTKKGTSGSGAKTMSGHITSERGDASTNGHEFSLEGKVVAETFDGYRLETSDVTYDHETRLATTDAPVALDGPGLSVSGRGAQVDFDNQQIVIRGRVRAHLVPQIIEAHAPQGVDLPGLQGPP